MSIPRFLPGALIPLLLAACDGAGGGSAAGWAGSVDTLASGAVRVHNPEAGAWDSAQAWRLEEEWRIGAADGSGPELFGQIRGLEVDDLGRVFVLDAQAREVRVFGTDGAHIRTVGREGAGPGEFRNPNGIARGPGGQIWVADPRNARYTVLDTAGTFTRAHPRPIGSYGYLWEGAFDDSARLYEYTSRRRDDGEREPVLVRLDSTGVLLDTIPFPVPPYRPEVYGIRMDGGFGYRMVTSVPFSPRLHRLVDRHGLLWSGVSDAYRIVQSSLQGDTLRIIERDHRPVPVTSTERDEALASDFLERMRQEGGEVDPDRVPSQKPAYQDFRLDPDGYLWVFATPESPGETALDVFDPEGRYLGRVRAPMELSIVPPPVIRGDVMYGVTRDELDVPYVVRLRIRGRP